MVIMIYNLILMFYVNLYCIIRFILLVYCRTINGEYIIITGDYFGFDKYSFYIILLSV
jgi:hypothetical protein